MHVEVFRGKDDHYGFVPSMDSSPLPIEFGPWRYEKAIDLQPDEPRLAMDAKAAIADISEKGWHMNRAKITFQISEQPL
jgi:hypothetical protein